MSQNSKKTTWMSRMTRLFRVTCADTSPLISELMDHDLPLGKRWRLKFHLMICGVCSIYKQQLEIIHALAQKLGHEEAPLQQEVVLSEQAKTKIKDTLKQSS
jgi:hypothetical protein